MPLAPSRRAAWLLVVAVQTIPALALVTRAIGYSGATCNPAFPIYLDVAVWLAVFMSFRMVVLFATLVRWNYLCILLLADIGIAAWLTVEYQTWGSAINVAQLASSGFPELVSTRSVVGAAIVFAIVLVRVGVLLVSIWSAGPTKKRRMRL